MCLRGIMVFAFAMLLNGEVQAEQNLENSNQTDLVRPQVASMVSSPGRCELKSGGKICQMTMSLIWEAPQEASYCIWHLSQVQSQAQPQSQLIKCWDDTWQGSVRLNFKSSQKVSFVLKAKGDDIEVAKTDVVVTASYKQRKRAQRRKRGFWRMF